MANKTKKGVIFFTAAFVGVVLLTFVAHRSSRFVGELVTPEGGINKLFTSGNLLVAVSKSNEVYVWNWNQLTSKPGKYSFDAEDLTVTEGGLVIFAPRLQPETLVIRDLQGKAEEKIIQLGENWRCKVLRTSRNGKFTAGGLVDETGAGRTGLAIVDPGAGRISKVTMSNMAGETSELKNVAVSEDGTLVAGIGSKNYGWVVMTNIKDDKILWGKTLEDTKRLHKVSFSPDGRKIFVGGNDLFIYGLETATGNVLLKWNITVSKKDPSYNQQKTISAIEAGPDNHLILVAGAYTRIFVLDSATSKQIDSINHRGWTIVDFAVSPDSTRFATADMRALSKIRIWRMPRVN